MQSTLTDNVAEHHRPVSSRDPLSHTTIHRHRVEARDVGAAGFVDGGTLLEWIHRAAHATATRWTGRCCVAVSLGNFHLNRPIAVGDVIDLHACLAYTGRSSMHVLVTVFSASPASAAAGQTSQCPVVFVAVDDLGKPVAVRPWTPESMLELQRHRQARVRARTRRRIEDAIAAQNYTGNGSASHAEKHIRVSRADVNRHGIVPGGRVMRWMDEVVNACAVDWSGVPGLTSYIAAIRFCSLIGIGDRMDVVARLVHAGPRSIHIGVRVVVADVVRGSTHTAAEGLIVVVSLDEHGNARPVRKWTPGSEEGVLLDCHAQHLVELRQFFEPYSTATEFVR